MLIQESKHLSLRARLSNAKLKRLWGSFLLSRVGGMDLEFLAKVTAVFSLVLEIKLGYQKPSERRKQNFFQINISKIVCIF